MTNVENIELGLLKSCRKCDGTGDSIDHYFCEMCYGTGLEKYFIDIEDCPDKLRRSNNEEDTRRYQIATYLYEKGKKKPWKLKR